MTLQQAQVLFQALSSLAIAGGFLYTARQFLNYRKAQHFANFSKLVELQMHLREMRVSDPSLAEVYRHDVAEMTSQAEIRQHFFNLMQLSVFEIVWFGHQSGQIPDDYFRSWEERMREIAEEESFRAMMASDRRKIMHDPFHRYMQGMLEQTAPARA
ncbi:MAG: hypothetical protein IT438_12340 [Phycisphaerales bacterium]|nr:hypothetical protein [Phycisphaerales bacterium]